jgi:hypothetical protein
MRAVKRRALLNRSSARSEFAMEVRMAGRSRKDSDTVHSIATYLQTPATNGFLVSQKLAMEAARFWARRMHAYADQMEEFARCSNAGEYISAQQHFIERLQEDYARETTAVADIFTAARDEAVRAATTSPDGEARRHA